MEQKEMRTLLEWIAQGTIRVDDAASELPAGVVLSDDRTMITMPYGAAELVMALDCDSELELQEVADRNLTVEHIAGEGGPAAKNIFRIIFIP